MKVYPFKIPKRPNERLLLQIDRPQRFYDKLHQHEEIQLSYIYSGRGKLIVGNHVTTFEAGNFVAIGANLPHVFLSHKESKRSHMGTLFFTKESFGEKFFDSLEMTEIRPLWPFLASGFKVGNESVFFKQLFSQCSNEDKYVLFINLLKLLRYLNQIKKRQLLSEDYLPKISNNQGQRLQRVFDFVAQQFEREIQLEEVAEKANMTKNAFCRFFKQRTNKTFFQFLAEIRIQHAAQLLKENQDLSIVQVAALSGYPTLSNFNRQFKGILQMNPSTYRKQFIHHFKG